ncbi:MAG TPA: FixH family protein [Acidiferrobacterales bacterium]|nr:FixH family protein [Acidiferrobacterales bacterium]
MNTTRAWYREPLVWLIISFPLSAVVAGFFTLYLAIISKDGLVVDDYYQKGKEINLSLARDRAAAQHGLRAGVTLDSAKQQVVVQLNAAKDQHLPDRLDLRWLHATRAGFDRTQMLIRSPDGRYRSAFPELAPGHWYVQIEAQDWRLQGSLRIPGEARLELVPSAIATAPAE